MKTHRSFLVLVGLWGSLSGLNALAADAPPTPDYHPSMGDLMTMAVQPRHIKLWLAGSQRNWAYATYEVSELRNAFLRVARTVPVYREHDVMAEMTAMTTAPLKEVEDAIKAGDLKHFTRAYEALTATCNACHQAQEHAMVVVKVPKQSMYPDQEFRVTKK